MIAKRKDGNHKQIKKDFLKLGCTVLDISNINNCCDIVVSFNYVTAFVEIKDPEKPPSKRRLTPGEQSFKDETVGLWFKCETNEDVRTITAELKKRAAL